MRLYISLSFVLFLYICFVVLSFGLLLFIFCFFVFLFVCLFLHSISKVKLLSCFFTLITFLKLQNEKKNCSKKLTTAQRQLSFAKSTLNERVIKKKIDANRLKILVAKCSVSIKAIKLHFVLNRKSVYVYSKTFGYLTKLGVINFEFKSELKLVNVFLLRNLFSVM